jgi:hypothetical protein
MPPGPIPPQPGQESVRDYPRPATLEDTTRHLKVICQGIVLAVVSGSWKPAICQPITFHRSMFKASTWYRLVGGRV